MRDNTFTTPLFIPAESYKASPLRTDGVNVLYIAHQIVAHNLLFLIEAKNAKSDGLYAVIHFFDEPISIEKLRQLLK